MSLDPQGKPTTLQVLTTLPWSSSATAATRDYVLNLDEQFGAPLLNIFGGKITTYRKLAEAAVALAFQVDARRERLTPSNAHHLTFHLQNKDMHL